MFSSLYFQSSNHTLPDTQGLHNYFTNYSMNPSFKQLQCFVPIVLTSPMLSTHSHQVHQNRQVLYQPHVLPNPLNSMCIENNSTLINDIPTVIGLRPNKKHHHITKSESKNLKMICTNQSEFRIAVFNAHSVQRRHRRCAILEFINDQNIDFMFVTETWLRPTGDENKLKHLTPKGYKIYSLPRETKGGGILVIYRDHIKVNITTSFSFEHKSFELLQLSITSPKHIHLFCIYKTPPRKKNGLKNSTFIDELPQLLDHVNLLRGNTVLFGDFNVHFNKKEEYLTKRILEITSSFDLVQGINEPTFYKSGNTVDWVLYREADNLVSKCEVNHTLFSDHSSVVCTLHCKLPKKPAEYKMIRNLKGINKELLKSDVSTLITSLGSSVSADSLDDGLRNILDKHAPSIEKKVHHRSDPWFPLVADELIQAKRERRRAERRHHKTRLTVDLNILRNCSSKVVDIVENARTNYLLSQISNCTDSKSLHKTSDKLLGKTHETILPTDLSDIEIPNSFSNFFSSKIKNIRSDLDINDDQIDPLFADSSYNSSTFESFCSVTQEEVRHTIMQSAKKTCPLDPIPTYLLIECLDELLPSITFIINQSLETGVFPDCYKKALVTPLLKKPSLDQNNLRNYRPVSNLSFLSKITSILSL